MNKYLLMLICLSLVILLTGCWDENDIEDRGFIVGTAIDLAETHEKDNPQVTMTSQFVAPSGLGRPGESGGGKPFTNLSVSGGSILGIFREMGTLTKTVPFLEHLKIIVVSEEVVKEPDLFSSLMDIFIRDHEMRREVRVLVSKGEARKILEMDPETANIPAMYINQVIENTNRSLDILEPIRIGDIHAFLLDRSSYVIPTVYASNNRVHYQGAGVFDGHNNSLAGILNDEETKGLNLINGEINGGMINFEIDNRPMTFEIENLNRNIKIDVKDVENIDISIAIEAEGIISEMFGSRSLLQPEYLSEIEENVGKKIEQNANGTLEKGQKELGIDFFDFHRILKQKHYDTWQQIKDNWDHGDNIFAQSNVDVSASVTIRSTGASDRTKDLGSE